MKKSFAFLAALLFAGASYAQVPEVPATLRVLSGGQNSDGRLIGGLHIQMQEGWRTYWRVPGEGGIPPRFDWSRSRNLESLRIAWPVPNVYYTFGYRSIGYKDELVLPLLVRPKDASKPVALNARIEIGVCESVCIPTTLRATGRLDREEGAATPLLRDALRNQPTSQSAAGVQSVRCKFEPISDGIKLRAEIQLPSPRADEEAVVELRDANIWVSTPETDRQGGAVTVTSELVPPNGQPFAMDRSDVRITLLTPGQAVDIQGCGKW